MNSNLLQNNDETNFYLIVSIASMALIFQPIGSIFSSFITDPLGRKQAMFIVNFPHVIAWLMMYNATSIRDIFIANILLGFGVGLMEAPILTYVGEIR